jgi:hypothetical protein
MSSTLVLKQFALAAPPLPSSCCLTRNQFSSAGLASTDSAVYASGQEQMIPHSGNSSFDYALAQTLALISKAFGVLPSFSFYNDSGALNARAISPNSTADGDGHVIFGTNLLQRTLAADSSGVRVAAVCSHEFGHIVQYKYGISDRLQAGIKTHKPVELHADFLAGYFAAKRQGDMPSFHAEQFAVMMNFLGDYQFGDPDHHGTAKERSNSVIEGFEAFHTRHLSLSDAVEYGINYVRPLGG